MLMEDLSHWKSATPGYPISKEQMILCLKNVAILHAKFWGLKNLDSLNIGIGKAEQDLRPAAYQKMSKLFLKKLVKNPNMLRKALNSLLKCELLTIWFHKFPKYLKNQRAYIRIGQTSDQNSLDCEFMIPCAEQLNGHHILPQNYQLDF